MCEIQGHMRQLLASRTGSSKVRRCLASYECVTVLEISPPAVEAARCIPYALCASPMLTLCTVASRNDASPLLPFLLLQGNNYYIIMATVALPAGHVGKEWN